MTDFKKARALLHEFKGSSYLFGADVLPQVGEKAAAAGKKGALVRDTFVRSDDYVDVIRDSLAQSGVNLVAVTSFADIPQALELDAVQIILCDHHYWGWMRQVRHLAKLCKVFGIGLSMHSNSHLGVSLMAMAHVAAATPHLTYACDTHYPWQSEKDEVVAGGRVPIADGCIRIPDEPGLGVELDYDQLARGRERYEKCPYRKRDDEAQMREHVDPNWKRMLPRW